MELPKYAFSMKTKKIEQAMSKLSKLGYDAVGPISTGDWLHVYPSPKGYARYQRNMRDSKRTLTYEKVFEPTWRNRLQ